VQKHQLILEIRGNFMYTLKKGNIIIEICENPLEIRSLKFKGKELCYQQDGA
jgi:hypothetical protein